MKKVTAALLLVIGALVLFAQAALACGYLSCTEHESYTECYWVYG